MQTKRLLRKSAIVLLLFNGINALAGGTLLMIDPTGALIKMPFHWIQNTFFTNYFVPGLILFVANGLASIAVAYLLIRNWKNAYLLTAAQGGIITGWIVIQIYLLKVIFWLHFLIGGIGIFLLFSGLRMSKHKSKI